MSAPLYKTLLLADIVPLLIRQADCFPGGKLIQFSQLDQIGFIDGKRGGFPAGRLLALSQHVGHMHRGERAERQLIEIGWPAPNSHSTLRTARALSKRGFS